jgi:hypothetical protein
MMRLPKTVGGTCDALIRIRDERLALQKQVDKLKESQTALEHHFVHLCRAQKTDSARGKLATCSYKVVPVPVVENWSTVYDYIVENDAFDLLHKRVSSTAWLERMEEGERIGGIKRETVNKVSIHKRGKAA